MICGSGREIALDSCTASHRIGIGCGERSDTGGVKNIVLRALKEAKWNVRIGREMFVGYRGIARTISPGGYKNFG